MQQFTPAPSSPPSSPYTNAGLSAQNIATNESLVEYSGPARNTNSAPFYVLTTLFNKLQNERKHEKRRKALDSWFNVCALRWKYNFQLNIRQCPQHWRKEMGYDLYPVLRLILPQVCLTLIDDLKPKLRKFSRTTLNGQCTAWKRRTSRRYISSSYLSLREILMQFVCWTGRDLQREMWASPSAEIDQLFISLQRNSGDFATVLYEVVNKRSSVAEGTLTIDDLNAILDELAENNGNSCVVISMPGWHSI